LILILTISFHRTLHTVPNLLTANSSFTILFYALIIIVQIIVGLKSKHQIENSLCVFLSFSTSIAANAICYSYLVTAISQYFFNILYSRKYLLTFRVHWFIILLSWCISIFLPLFLYIPGALQYSPEMHMCTMKMSVQWMVFIYMGTAIGIPFFGIIIIIYRYIARFIRHTDSTSIVGTNSTRDLRVIKHMLTLIGVLGTAGLPSLILVIWNVLTIGKEPISLYLICILTISLCTNIQISFIFLMNQNVRSVFGIIYNEYFIVIN
jgi:hypothetical protein